MMVSAPHELNLPAQSRWQNISDAFEGSSPEEILAWAAEQFPGRATLATAFGKEGCCLIDMIARKGLNIDLFTIDTGLFFPETYALWSQLEEQYGVTIRAVRPDLSLDAQAAAHGDRLWETDPNHCCAIRKIAPLRRAVAGFDAWVTAVRRDQTVNRQNEPIVSIDERLGVVKVNPLVNWTAEDVENYLHVFEVPTNPLHEQGYPSIGCQPCTSQVAEGEDPRSGRWRGSSKTECGLHVRLPIIGQS